MSWKMSQNYALKNMSLKKKSWKNVSEITGQKFWPEKQAKISGQNFWPEIKFWPADEWTLLYRPMTFKIDRYALGPPKFLGISLSLFFVYNFIIQSQRDPIWAICKSFSVAAGPLNTQNHHA